MKLRTIDRERVLALAAEGLSAREIAPLVGSRSPVYVGRIISGQVERKIEYHRAWQRQGVCPDCGGQSSRTGGQGSHHCRACANAKAATSVRADELQCQRCRAWKPDEEFPRDRGATPARRGRHRQTRVAPSPSCPLRALLRACDARQPRRPTGQALPELLARSRQGCRQHFAARSSR